MKAIAALVACIAAPAAAQGGFHNIYQDESVFRSEVGSGIALATESFETIAATPGGPIAFAGGSISCAGGFCSEFGKFAGGATDGSYGIRFVGPDTLTFTFDRAINAFAVDVVGLGNFDPSALVATWNGRTRYLQTVNFPSNNRLFAGLADDQGFTSLSLTVTSVGDGVLLDRMQTGIGRLAVPEPATWAMMIVGFGAVGAGMRRRVAVLA